MDKKIQVIQGPNLNLLGAREPEIYGNQTLKDINNQCKNLAEKLNFQINFFQSNAENEIIDCIQNCNNQVDFIIINPAAFTHTSIAIRDALVATSIPFIEVHLSNIFNREEFRRRSYLSDRAVAVVTGMGSYGYICAINYLKIFFEKTNSK